MSKMKSLQLQIENEIIDAYLNGASTVEEAWVSVKAVVECSRDQFDLVIRKLFGVEA